MMPIEEQLIAFFTTNSKQQDLNILSKRYPHFHKKLNAAETISHFRIKEVTISNCVIDYIEFDNARFEGVVFSNVNFFYCDFISCTFKNCRFENVFFNRAMIYDCSFEDLHINGAQFHAVDLANTNFIGLESCIELIIKGSFINKVFFSDGDIFALQISESAPGKESLTFNNIALSHCSIYNYDFSESKFRNCSIDFCSFNSCMFDEYTFLDSCKKKEENINYIDLQTILHSTFNEVSYQLFGINKNSDAKEYISAITKEVKFQSVFISYSFKDSAFARYLNEKIRIRGVNTFLWEHDAPGGKRLQKIMQEYIRKHDRVLFIASCNSLKSKACHFELSEARMIQDKEWKDVYYPIHIDDYLFQVQKDDIRPKEYREEYWKNIEEILDFNSLPFIEYKDSYHNNPAFEEQVDNLVKNLKI